MAKQTFTTGQVLTAAQMTSLQQTAMLGGAASAKTASYTLVAADAGSAISMSNASATTITVNTSLFAAGDTVQITNLGAGVCTITAGTATVNTSASLALAQYESGTLDFTSTSAAIFIKGAGAAAASGGMTVISSGSLTGAGVDLTSISGYNDLQLVLRDFFPSSASTSIRIRVNANSGGNYSSSIFRTSSSSIDNGTGANQVSLNDGATQQSNSNTNAHCVIDFFDYANATSKKLFSSYYVYNSTITVGGANSYNVAEAITQINIAPNSGNFGGGTYVLYGIK